MIWRCTGEQLAQTIIGNEPLAVCYDMQFSNSDESSSPLASPALLTSTWGEQWPGPGVKSVTWETSNKSWQEPAGESISCFTPWSCVPCLGLLLHFTSVSYEFQQYPSMAGVAARYILNCIEGSERRGYKAMQAYTWKDNQGILSSGLTSFRIMCYAEKASWF